MKVKYELNVIHNLDILINGIRANAQVKHIELTKDEYAEFCSEFNEEKTSYRGHGIVVKIDNPFKDTTIERNNAYKILEQISKEFNDNSAKKEYNIIGYYDAEEIKLMNKKKLIKTATRLNKMLRMQYDNYIRMITMAFDNDLRTNNIWGGK